MTRYTLNARSHRSTMIIPQYPQEGFPVSAMWGRQVVDCIRALRLIAGRNMRKEETPDGTIAEALVPAGAAASGSGLDLSKFAFGLSVSGSTITVKSGEVQWGLAVHSVAEQTFTISADYSYVGLEFDNAAAAFIGPSTSISSFRSDASKVRLWLYQVRYTAPTPPATSGAVALHRIGHVGNILLPGNFA